MATHERSGFVKDDLDALQAQISIEQACNFYGIETGELRTIGAEIRARCFLNCGKEESTGERALAIRSDGVKRWHCHEYGCGKGGNLIGLCNYLKEGIPDDGPPRRARFKQIHADLKAMAGGTTQQITEATREHQTTPPPTSEPKVNVLLKDKEKEQACKLVTLDEKFLVVPDEKMNRYAASYQRQRPFLTPELCREERCGYLPRPGSGGDRRGGTLQGKWIYCYADEQGEPIAWFGRNLQYEEQHQEWIVRGRKGKEPEKFHFVKGFHRSIEVYGQHEWNIEAIQQKIRNEIGALLLVEGPNDRIALKSLGVPAFAICSNRIAAAQTARVAAKATEIGVPVGLLFDNDAEGESGAKQGVYDLAQHCPVRVLWSPTLFDGKFRNRQPESLTSEEWQEIHAALQRGGVIEGTGLKVSGGELKPATERRVKTDMSTDGFQGIHSMPKDGRNFKRDLPVPSVTCPVSAFSQRCTSLWFCSADTISRNRSFLGTSRYQSVRLNLLRLRSPLKFLIDLKLQMTVRPWALTARLGATGYSILAHSI